MNTRDTLFVDLLKVTIATSATATAAGSAVDLRHYFPVGKREVKFVVGAILNSTTTGFVTNVTIQECDSTATASFTNVTSAAGSTLTLTTTDATHYWGELHGLVTKRYVRVLYNAGQATTGNYVSIVAAALPHVRLG